jgi:hypothetical protein
MKRKVGFGLASLGVLAAGAAVYALWFRRWQARWGAYDEELSLPLPGDDIVANPSIDHTRAITIEAEPTDIWPWLVQMGKHRGGLYSYDCLDTMFGYLDGPSSESILPDFQDLKKGDVMPIGRDETDKDDFYVHIADKYRALVIGANNPAFRNLVSWAMVLIPIGSRTTRLIVRVRGKMDEGIKSAVIQAALEPASFVMLRKQMLNLKRLAERSAAERFRSSAA